MRTALAHAGLALLLTLLPLAVVAGPEPRPHLEAVHFTTPPTLDGDLSDACWQQTAPITDLRETSSRGAPKEPTTVWLGHDERYIYWGIYCKDSQPDHIRADQRKRGGNLNNDDVAELGLDTYQSGKECYWFDFNPRGTQSEYVPSGSAEKTEWRGDWEVATRLVADGWCGEARIPLSMLRYPKGIGGFNVIVSRRLAREGEWYAGPGTGGWDLERAAQWSPLRLPTPRPQVTTMVYAVPQWNEGATRLDLGLDAKCVMPSGMEAQLTLNPDFEDVEQQVAGIDFTYNERWLSDARPFFVEGQGFYPSDSVFYTRRLESIDIGAKWFGRLGKQRWGFLDAWDTGHRHTGVANWVWDFRPYSQVSALAVLDDHEGDFNAQYGAGVLLGAKIGAQGSRGVSLNAYSTDVPGGSGTRQRWSSDAYYNTGSGHFGGWGGYYHVAEGFSPSVAYYPESGLQGWWSGLYWSDNYRTGPLRYHSLSANVSHTDNLDGSPHDHTWSIGGDFSLRGFQGAYLGHSETRRPPYHDRVESVSLSWRSNDMYRRGGLSHNFGRREGGDYRYTSAYQGFRLSRCMALQANASWYSLQTVDSHGSSRQLVLTGTYEIDPENSISMRLVDNTGDFNAYLAYSRKVRRGTDLFVIVGDPNASEFTERVAVKTVWAF